MSLEQITGRMAKIRAEQEARLASLSYQRQSTNYEQKAKVMLETENVARDVFKRSEQTAPALPTSVGQGRIEIAPQSPTSVPTAAKPDQTTASAVKKSVTVE